MADKLEWMNQHALLFRHLTVQDAIDKEKYKLRPDLEPLKTAPDMTSEEFLAVLKQLDKNKEAIDFLAYSMHRRAAIWWGYRCLLSLFEELAVSPVQERPLDDIGKPKPMELPDWIYPPDYAEIMAAKEKEKAKGLAQLEQLKTKLEQSVADAKKLIPPEVQHVWDEVYGAVQAKFKEVHGISMDELLEKAVDKSFAPAFEIDQNSPLFKAADELEQKIEAGRKETIELVKAVIPPKMPEHDKKVRDSAMQAVYRWVVSPDPVNSQAAFDIGNECADTPAGLLALAAFWSYGDMMPSGKQVIPTPSGLAANGLTSVFLQAALHKGGTRKYKERCKLYLEIGLDVLRGKDVWYDSLSEPVAPHHNIRPSEPVAQSMPPTQTQSQDAEQSQPVSQPANEPERKVYTKWKPKVPDSDL